LRDEKPGKGETRDALDGRAGGLQKPPDDTFRLRRRNVPRLGMRERAAPLTRNRRGEGAAPRGGSGGTPREQGLGPTGGEGNERVRDRADLREGTQKGRRRRLREKGR